MQMVAKHPEQRRVARKVDGISLIVDRQHGNDCSRECGFDVCERSGAALCKDATRKRRAREPECAQSNVPQMYSYHRGFRESRETPDTASRPVFTQRTAYNRVDRRCVRIDSMEAERVNQIANLLSDLQQRAADLRRYL